MGWRDGGMAANVPASQRALTCASLYDHLSRPRAIPPYIRAPNPRAIAVAASTIAITNTA